MKKLCAALLGLLLASAAQAQSVSWPPPAGSIAFLCVYNVTPPTLTTTNVAFAQCDATGNLRIAGTVTANVAGATSNASSGVATSATNIPVVAYTYGFNGTTWDQLQVDGSKFLKIVLAAETTKVIGTVNQGTSPWVVSGTVGTTEPVGITPTDRTVTSATGASQTMMAANASRHSITIENTGNANCGVNPTGGTAAIGGAGTITLNPLGAYTPRVPTLSAVTVICTAGQPIYGDEN